MQIKLQIDYPKTKENHNQASYYKGDILDVTQSSTVATDRYAHIYYGEKTHYMDWIPRDICEVIKTDKYI